MLLRLGLLQIKLQVERLESSTLTERSSLHQGSAARMEASLAESKEKTLRYISTHVGQW